MLITKIEELTAIYPTSRFSTLTNLSNLFENVERGVLQQILGSALLQQLIKDYRSVCDLEDGIWANRQDEPDDKIYILRACQSVEVYCALNDNVGILSSSLNAGGGFNQATAGNYDTLDNDVRKDLKNDLYHGSRRAIEQLLMLLEEDANNAKIYTTLWQTSPYYYEHYNLMFPSAISLHPQYVDLGSEPHSKYISLVSTIADCQERNINLRIGDTLTESLIKLIHGESLVTDEVRATVTRSMAEIVASASSATPDLTSAETAVLRESVLRNIVCFVRRSLANYIKAELADKQADKDRLENRAEIHMNIAIRHLLVYPSVFHDEFATDLAKDYRDTYGKGIDDKAESEMTDKERHDYEEKKRHQHDVFVLGGLHGNKL